MLKNWPHCPKWSCGPPLPLQVRDFVWRKPGSELVLTYRRSKGVAALEGHGLNEEEYPGQQHSCNGRPDHTWTQGYTLAHPRFNTCLSKRSVLTYFSQDQGSDGLPGLYALVHDWHYVLFIQLSSVREVFDDSAGQLLYCGRCKKELWKCEAMPDYGSNKHRECENTSIQTN